ncbi:MAG: hypothetical protein P1U87_00910 [Verrucomicrobiales bacterium]|nr:hypothetical protein [Verrucomicrobiales bacterium]
MTSGSTATSTARQMQMMQVRTAAQSAQGDAVAASMSRTADRTIDQQNQDRVLQMAREEKAIKRQMAERMKWERANAAQVNKVSANDMSTWKTNGGNVRVERNVPDPFITALIQEERQLAAEEAAAGVKEPGIGPFGKLNPFKRNRPAETRVPGLVEAIMESEPTPSTSPAPQGYDPNVDVPSGGGGGFFSKLKPPRIGGRREEEPIDASSAEPQFVQTSSSRPAAPTPAVASIKPGTIPRISGAALVDGSSPVNSGAQAAAPAPQPQPSSVSFADEMPDSSNERGGLFSKMKSSGSNSGGGGLFSFGKKKSSQPEAGTIDASLFPAGSVAQAPTGGSLGGGYTSQDVAQDAAVAPSSTGSVQLPGMEAEKRSSGFSFPKPKINVPKPSSSGGGGNVPTMTTVNSAGNSYYVVTSTAQIMVYGENQMQSEIRALPAGMVVQMTKPGETWASVRLSNGTEGIVQNKFLRAASSSEVGAQFAPSN